MKKLYRKGTVHPSPPIISDHLSFLPAAILTLTVALSPEDREVLAYLISSSSVNDFHANHKNTHHGQKPLTFAKTITAAAAGSGNSNDHPPLFNCECFRCYKSYWVRWDSSPNRQLIHEIIDAFEDDQLARSSTNNNSKKKIKNNNSKKDKKKRGVAVGVDGSGSGNGSDNSGELKRSSTDHHHHHQKSHELAESESSAENSTTGSSGSIEEDNTEKGSVRTFVSFIGEKLWGVWG